MAQDCITRQEYERNYKGYNTVKALYTVEDIATFIDTFKRCNIDGCSIIKVLEHRGRYIFVYEEGYEGYDFFKELNELSQIGQTLSPINIYYICPESKSRYSKVSSSKLDRYEADTDDDESETGTLDDDDTSILEGFANLGNLSIRRVSTGEERSISGAAGIVLGRSSKTDFSIKGNDSVSRTHARIFKRGANYYIEDLNSRNGTFVNNDIVRDKAKEINKGDSIILGDEEFEAI